MEQVITTDTRWAPEVTRRPDSTRRPEPSRRPDSSRYPEPSRRPDSTRRPEPSRRLIALVAAVAGTLTLAVRLVLHVKSVDLFGDEVIYADLGRSAVNGGFPSFYGPFFLHGPGYFYLEAGWAHL